MKHAIIWLSDKLREGVCVRFNCELTLQIICVFNLTSDTVDPVGRMYRGLA